ncbi:MAG: hypothetical protein A2286_09845 [Gammaproteobacteria bacterium RIFOXYA12_FULL_61_12]|nr:MAG: hypothetical protein A2514_02750 [Gammaproteobacteria bacterium RIFOXYD12_FULL_61_37]OGT90502.1 MAG: hypothetical protein A2286_09845 [Gammaproteobacteria bacterium RIFOXYA12_FULL_61_12]
MSRSISAIALYTDFGPLDHYLGQMRAVLHDRVPSLPVYDLMSNAPRFDPRASAYLLAAILDDLPSGTLVVAIVDPGVGSNRKALMVQTCRHVLIGPDNGLLTLAARRSPQLQAWKIDWTPVKLSTSFHGRDLFAPVAAMVARGEPFPASPLSPDALVGWDWPDDLAEVIHADVYGNLITGLRTAKLDRDALIRAGGHLIANAGTFSEAPPGALFWYGNSSGLVEIACNQDSAAGRLGIGIGDKIDLLGKGPATANP